MLKTKKTRPSKTIQIADQLRNDIRFGIFKDGERLKEEYLSVRYHASRIPVREALQILKAEGFVEISSSSGIEVRNISIAELHEALDLFQVIFMRILKTSITRITEEDCIKINEYCNLLAACDDLNQFDTLLLTMKGVMMNTPELQLFPFILGLLYKKLGAFIMFLFKKKMNGTYDLDDFRFFTRLINEKNYVAAYQLLNQHVGRYIAEMKLYSQPLKIIDGRHDLSYLLVSPVF